MKSTYHYFFSIKFSYIYVCLFLICLTGCVISDKRVAKITEISISQDNTNSISFYIVQPGDNLSSIANRHNVSLKTIRETNGINSDNIRVGDMICIPVSYCKKNIVNNVNKSLINSDIYREDQNIKKEQSDLNISFHKKILWDWPSDGSILEKFDSYNRGIDISGSLGDCVRSSADGTVVYSGSGVRGLGKLLIISHDDNFISAYAHNSKLLVNNGEIVLKGMKIAEMGNSDTDYCKLHFEIRKNGIPMDPLQLLPKR